MIERIQGLVGTDVLRITAIGSGWPALGTLIADSAETPVAIFAGSIGLSHRGRDDVERRFQNPGSDRPITQVADRFPLLLGLWENDPVLQVNRPLLVSADAVRRVGRVTRFSVFVSTTALVTALRAGWWEEENTTGEAIRCFTPSLLPVGFLAERDGASPDPVAMHTAIQGSGLLESSDGDDAASARARRAGSILVRDAKFSQRVVDAYGGLCAMCGLGAGLAQAAHIYPVSAPGSHDEPWNGLALCPNHHAAFDRHVLAVRPDTLELVFNDEVAQQASASPAVRALISGTFSHLARPMRDDATPRREVFEQRYEFYVNRYNWLL